MANRIFKQFEEAYSRWSILDVVGETVVTSCEADSKTKIIMLL